MRNRKRTAMAAAVIMAGMLSAFPTQAVGTENQENVQNQLEEYGAKQQEIETPQLLSIDGTEMKLGEVHSLSGGGTAELVRDESTQKLVLTLKDAVIGGKEEWIPIKTMESLLIRIQGNCTITVSYTHLTLPTKLEV